MEVISMSTDKIPNADRGDSWRETVSSMIHNVEVTNASSRNFSAGISARRHNGIACGSFWSKPHELRSGRERFSDAGVAGYLVSWQIEGDAYIGQGNDQLRQRPGSVAIIDGRRPMHVAFPNDVRRIIAKLPARLIEDRLPYLMASHTLVFDPQGPFASMLFSYLMELSKEDSPLIGSDVELLVENISNLLRVTSNREGFAACGSKELRRQALLRYIKQEACDPNLSLERVAGHLSMSRRLVQQILQEMESSFTGVVTEERLLSAAKKLFQASDLPIAHVAYSSGFNDVSHFNHLFKQRFGMPPTDYRRSAA
jgi:AraC family transcriptional activator of tynA and feaB